MITSSRFLIQLVAISGLCLLTGCASVQFDDYLGEPVSPPSLEKQKILRPKTHPAKAIDFPAKPGWNCVTFCGEVVYAQGPADAVRDARVALMEGSEELSCTTTDRAGCFELTCDLYGKPFTCEDGVCRWCPEEYYALTATDRSGAKGKVLLRDTPLGGRVRIPLD